MNTNQPTEQEKEQRLIVAAFKEYPIKKHTPQGGNGWIDLNLDERKAFLNGAKSEAGRQYWFNQKIKADYTPEDLINLLEDVVNELDLSDSVIEEHGPLGTPPSKLVRLVLEQKDLQIHALKAEMKDVSDLKNDSDQTSKIEELEKEVKRLTSENIKYDSISHDNDNTISNLATECKELSEENTRLQKELEELKEKAESLVHEAEKVIASRSGLNAHIQELEEALHQLKSIN